MPEEQVLVVPTALVHDCGEFQGYSPMSDTYLPIFQRENQSFKPRAEVEDDPSFKQLIPYIILRIGERYMHYRRHKLSGEKRLAGKRSVGIGGHINPCDLTEAALGRLADRPDYLDDCYVNGMLRELLEELRFPALPDEWDMEIVGLINDDSNPVGRVHIGVAHLLRLERGARLEPREENIQDIRWNHGYELTSHEVYKELEPWSQIAILQHAAWRRQRREKPFLRGRGT